MSTPSKGPRRSMIRRVYGAMNLTLFLFSVLVIVAAVNFMALRYSLQFDATKTRAYSLSEQTERLLAQLEGHWTIALLMEKNATEPALRRQIDEVLRRFSERAPDLSITRIDPTDPGAVADYDALMIELQRIYSGRVDEYDQALDEGEQAFVELQLFAQQQAGSLQGLLARLTPAQIDSNQLETRSRVMNLLASESDKALQVIRETRQVSDTQPIPDYEGARSILHSALREWSNQLDDLSLIFERLQATPDLDVEALRNLTGIRPVYEAMAQRLAIAADPLARLEPLALSSIGRQIQEGECALIIGPDGAVSIRSAQLFPKTNIRTAADSAVTFDQRFRGEQLIASSIRAMLRDAMPMIVFVHADDQSMFNPTEAKTDLSGIRNILSTAHFDVAQWPVSQMTQRPELDKGQPAVWVIVPPTVRESLEPSEAELKLIEAAKSLIADGEPVLLNLYPSPLIRFGQSDPWAETLAPLGLIVDTARTIFEQRRFGGGQTQIDQGQTIQEFVEGHAITEAVQGLPTYFGLPMSISVKKPAPSGVNYAVLALVEPSENRWLEEDWRLGAQGVDDPDPDQRFDQAQPIAVAIQRDDPGRGSAQRCMVVSSGGWMLSYIADRVFSVGGDRIALEFPGNYEFMLASLAWLAGEDDLIAPSPMSQEVARLKDVTPADRRRWFWLTIAGLPGACILLGLFTWFLRRF